MPTPLAHLRDLAVIMRNPHHRRHPHRRLEGQRVPVVITSNPVRPHHRPLHERFRKRVQKLQANRSAVNWLRKNTPHLLLKMGRVPHH
ncbi:hypothetical protein AFERRID_07360 [Acidithiobacillus ferridurans]|uniref:Uncharacterized protein n=1 Tax=Acidithiobacillus ferridurans TaxID=1232575 RepID=A0A2Z6IFT0_ACIFI|nr:hypothetical protein AFERRID_07360 [Acidithiobacillus ferridurans]